MLPTSKITVELINLHSKTRLRLVKIVLSFRFLRFSRLDTSASRLNGRSAPSFYFRASIISRSRETRHLRPEASEKHLRQRWRINQKCIVPYFMDSRGGMAMDTFRRAFSVSNVLGTSEDFFKKVLCQKIPQQHSRLSTEKDFRIFPFLRYQNRTEKFKMRIVVGFSTLNFGSEREAKRLEITSRPLSDYDQKQIKSDKMWRKTDQQ